MAGVSSLVTFGNESPSIPERTIQSTREFRGIAHEHDLVREVMFHQLMFDSAYSPIHHIARGNAMHASLRIAQRNVSNAGDRQRRINRMIVLKDSAVTMRRVFTQAHVRCQVE